MSPDLAFERRVAALLRLMPVPHSSEEQILQVARVRATLAESDRVARGRDHQVEWSEPEASFGLGRDLPCLAQSIRD